MNTVTRKDVEKEEKNNKNCIKKSLLFFIKKDINL